MTDNEVVLLVVIVLLILSRCGCKGTGRSRVYTRKPPATEPPTFRETGERCGELVSDIDDGDDWSALLSKLNALKEEKQ